MFAVSLVHHAAHDWASTQAMHQSRRHPPTSLKIRAGVPHARRCPGGQAPLCHTPIPPTNQAAACPRFNADDALARRSRMETLGRGMLRFAATCGTQTTATPPLAMPHCRCTDTALIERCRSACRWPSRFPTPGSRATPPDPARKYVDPADPQQMIESAKHLRCIISRNAPP